MQGQSRVIIENIEPVVSDGKYYAKRVQNDLLHVAVDLVADGHDTVNGCVYFRHADDKQAQSVPLVEAGNDRWKAEIPLKKIGFYSFAIGAWIDQPLYWLQGLRKKIDAEVEVSVELLDGVAILKNTAKKASEKEQVWLNDVMSGLTAGKLTVALKKKIQGKKLEQILRAYPLKDFETRTEQEYRVWVDRPKANFSTWYEVFPRSTSPDPARTGTLRDTAALLPRISDMGFDVLYVPPIHPVGELNRKGKNNNPSAREGEVGSPWAIGSQYGGHKAIHPELGTLADFDFLMKECKKNGVELAMDFALQCAPDHPFVKEHPEWFKWRSDGTVQYAENPPKKYQDILPIDFETSDWENLWNELLSIALFWAERGVRIFRVDNPHTKPYQFWGWLIDKVHEKYPDFLFLSEAFSRPKVMHQLAKQGFTQSYSYFTWRNTKHELSTYFKELTQGPGKEYFRPNFWPNTPDINPYLLQGGSEHAHLTRFFLAATGSGNYGMYGPVFEQMVHEALPGREEYLDSEKFEAKHWDWNLENRLTHLIKTVNSIRSTHSALQQTLMTRVCAIENEHIFAYFKQDASGNDNMLMVVNLDPYATQTGWVQLPLNLLGLTKGSIDLVADDLITGNGYRWNEEWNYVELRPEWPFHLFHLHS